MASSAIYDACLTFLESDVRTTVNAEQSNLLVSGSVFASRGRARKPVTYSTTVQIVPVDDVSTREVGLNLEEIDQAFELVCTVRRKATADGASPMNVAEDVARALHRRYSRVSNLAIAPSNATLVASRSERRSINEDPEAGEVVRSVVRVTLTFTEDLAANT